MSQNEFIFNATQHNFEKDVVMASMQVPVLIDFWAPWCGPCKQLTPIIENLVTRLNGAVHLAKVNTDEEMALASMFQIRSIPTVMLLFQGQPIDGFMGAQPESAIRAMLEKHLGPLDDLLAASNADANIDTDGDNAEATPQAVVDWEVRVQELRDAIAKTPEQRSLSVDLAEALIHTGELAEADSILEHLPADVAASDAAKRAQARLAFARALTDAPPRASLQARVEANDGDLQTCYWLGARALFDGDATFAITQFLSIMQRDRKFQDDLGRKSLIQAFLLINDDDLISQTRRKMSALVF